MRAPVSAHHDRRRARARSACADQLLGAVAVGVAQQLLGLAGRVPELEQPVARERARVVPARRAARRSACAPRRRRRSSTPTFSRSSTMIRSAVRLPMPGTAWKRAASPAASAADQLARRPAGEHRQRDLRPDRLHRQQHQEQVALLLGVKAVQRQRVVAHDQVRVQRRPARRRRARGAASRAETAAR